MGNARLAESGGSLRMMAAAGAVLVSAAVAVGGPAAAAAYPSVVRAPRGPDLGTAGVISTVAGGVGGPGNATSVALTACNVAFAQGHLYIADSTQGRLPRSSGAVREMSPGSSLLTTPAGTHAAGPLGDGGPATAATLNSCGVTADSSGNLVISDWRSNRVRVVAASTGTFYGQAMTAGDIYTVAGGGTSGLGDGGPATSAELSAPQGVRVDHNGNLVIADAGNDRVRVVAASTGTFYGVPMTTGDIYTVAGDGIRGFSGDFGPATSAELNGRPGCNWTTPGTC